jgi:hypothetical protein
MLAAVLRMRFSHTSALGGVSSAAPPRDTMVDAELAVSPAVLGVYAPAVAAGATAGVVRFREVIVVISPL